MSTGDHEGGSRISGFFGLVPSRRKSSSPPAPMPAVAPVRPPADGAASDATASRPVVVDEAVPASADRTWSVLNGLPMTSRAATLSLSESEKRRAWMAEPTVAPKPAPEPAMSDDATARKAAELTAGLRRMSREHRMRATAGGLGTEAPVAAAVAPAPVIDAATAPKAAKRVDVVQPQAPQVRSTRVMRTTAAEDAPVADAMVKPAPAPRRRRSPKPASSRVADLMPVAEGPAKAVASSGAKTGAKTGAAARGDDAGALDLGAMSVRQVFGRLRDAAAKTSPSDAPADASASVESTAAKWPSFFRKTDRA